MNTASIRVRLTVWYTTILAVTLLAFGGATWLGLRHSLLAAVDASLNDRMEGVTRFMAHARSFHEIQEEFNENVALGPGGDLFQVCDSSGQWLHRSPVLEAAQVPILLPDQLGGGKVFEEKPVRGATLRFLSEGVAARGDRFTVQLAVPVDPVRQALSTFAWILLLLFPPMLILAGLGGYWMSARALRPVAEVVGAARSINAANLSQRLRVAPTGDEVQELSETLNGMLDRLENAFQRVTRFTGDASHELRTPVALIRTTSEVALRKTRSIDEYQEALREIGAESERTSALIEDLLTLARADAGLAPTKLKDVELGTLVAEIAGLATEQAASQGVGFDTWSEPVTVPGDEVALRRLVWILVDNALKYTPARGVVVLRVCQAEGSGMIEVRDTGVGIGDQDLPFIFERFYRADKARNRDSGGAGLGLSIAKWIVDIHHGSIQVSSKPGEGSVFQVLLPMGDPGENGAIRGIV